MLISLAGALGWPRVIKAVTGIEKIVKPPAPLFGESLPNRITAPLESGIKHSSLRAYPSNGPIFSLKGRFLIEKT
jgi:hypothetical protein